jgi:hypothetical protein
VILCFARDPSVGGAGQTRSALLAETVDPVAMPKA